MKKETLITISFIFVILLVAGTIIYFKILKVQEVSKEDAEYIGNNSILYTQEGCIHCKEQLDLFGENAKYLNIVDCFKETEKCINITKTPTWIIKGNKYEGVKSIEELKELI